MRRGGRVDAVAGEAVIGGHDRPDARVDDRFERREVHLAQRALVDAREVLGAVGLGLVADEVLDAGGDPLRLDRVDEGDGEPSREERVLRQALEVPATHRAALQVDPGARITSTALRRASAAISVARRACRSTSQVAAVADGAGSWADGSPSSPVPRTPMGPSDTVMVRRPSSGTARRVQVAAPVSSATSRRGGAMRRRRWRRRRTRGRSSRCRPLTRRGRGRRWRSSLSSRLYSIHNSR